MNWCPFHSRNLWIDLRGVKVSCLELFTMDRCGSSCELFSKTWSIFVKLQSVLFFVLLLYSCITVKQSASFWIVCYSTSCSYAIEHTISRLVHMTLPSWFSLFICTFFLRFSLAILVFFDSFVDRKGSKVVFPNPCPKSKLPCMFWDVFLIYHTYLWLQFSFKSCVLKQRNIEKVQCTLRCEAEKQILRVKKRQATLNRFVAD